LAYSSLSTGSDAARIAADCVKDGTMWTAATSVL
jgi:hypothetical protein